MIEKTFAVLFAAGLVLSPLPGAGKAGCRHVQVVQQQAVVAYQPITQPYYWSVGQSLQEDAAAERIAAKVLQLLQGQAQKLTSSACPDGTCPTPRRLPLTVPAPLSLLAKNCQGCHQSNAKAQAAFDMSDLSALTCEQKLAAIAAVVDGRMPKGKQLDAQTLGDLIGQLSGAKTAPQ